MKAMKNWLPMKEMGDFEIAKLRMTGRAFASKFKVVENEDVFVSTAVQESMHECYC